MADPARLATDTLKVEELVHAIADECAMRLEPDTSAEVTAEMCRIWRAALTESKVRKTLVGLLTAAIGAELNRRKP
jgi:hypothetical protein